MPVYIADLKSPAPNELGQGVVCTVKYRSNVLEGIVAAVGMCISHMYIHTCKIYCMYRIVQDVKRI